MSICANTTCALKRINMRTSTSARYSQQRCSAALPPAVDGQMNKCVHLGSAVLATDTAQKLFTLIHVLLQIRQTYWCLWLTDI
jgi:hypothetical protein